MKRLAVLVLLLGAAASASTIARAGPDRRALSGDVVTVDGTGSSSDAGQLTFAWTQLTGDAGVLFSSSSAAAPSFIAPSVSADELATLRLEVSAGGESATDEVSVTIRPSGAPLITSHPESVAFVGEAWRYEPSLRNGPATWAVTSAAVASVDAGTGAMSWTPAAEGTVSFELSATTGAGVELQRFDVLAVSRPTITSVPALTGTAYQSYRYDDDGRPSVTGTGPFSWTVVSGPDELFVRGTTGEIIWTPVTTGSYPVELAVDSPYGRATQAFTIVVSSGGAPNIEETANLVGVLGMPYLYDADLMIGVQGAPPFTFSKVEGPAELNVDPLTGYVSWLPARAGNELIRVKVSSPAGEDSYSFTVAVAASAGSAGPRAVLTVTPTSGTAPLDVTADGSSSVAGDAPIVSYKWEFGDGTPPVFGAQATHRFAVAGGYWVRLTVSDAQGRTDSLQVSVQASDGAHTPPSARIILPGAVSGQDSLTVELSCDCRPGDSPITAIKWDYGDGDSSNRESPTHTYSTPGVYVIRLVVVDANGLSSDDSASVEVTAAGRRPPLVRVYADPTSGSAPLLATFGATTGGQSSQIKSRVWTFSDGEQSSQLTPVRRLGAPSVLTAQLTVTDDNGLTSSDRVTVEALSGSERAPRILSLPARKAFVGIPWSYDEDGRPAARGDRPLVWELGVKLGDSVTGAPEGMTVVSDTGELKWSPTKPGVYDVSLLAKNATGYDVQRFTVEVGGEEKKEKTGCSLGGGGTVLAVALATVLSLRRRRRAR